MVNKQNVKMMTVAAIIGVSAIGATAAFAAGSSSTPTSVHATRNPKISIRLLRLHGQGVRRSRREKLAGVTRRQRLLELRNRQEQHGRAPTPRFNPGTRHIRKYHQVQGPVPRHARRCRRTLGLLPVRGRPDEGVRKRLDQAWRSLPCSARRWHQPGDRNQDLLGDQFRHQHMPDEGAAPDGCCRVSFRKRRCPRPPFRQQPRNHPEAGDVRQPLRGRI